MQSRRKGAGETVWPIIDSCMLIYRNPYSLAVLVSRKIERVTSILKFLPNYTMILQRLKATLGIAWFFDFRPFSIKPSKICSVSNLYGSW